MKKATYIIGYVAVLLSVVFTIIKITHLNIPTGPIYSSALLLLSIYFPLYILDKARDSGEGKMSVVNIVSALCSFFIVLAILFRVQHWPLATALITIGLIGFVLIFLPMLCFQKSRQAGANNLMNGTAALSLAMFALGVLNKVLHWPGPLVLFITGTALLFLIYIPILAMNKTIPEEKLVKHLRDSYFAIIIGCLILLFTWGLDDGKLIQPGDEVGTTEQRE